MIGRLGLAATLGVQVASESNSLPFLGPVLARTIPSELGAGMRRREFIKTIAGAVAWPLAALAAEPSKVYRIAIVSPATRVEDVSISGKQYFRVFFEELARLGYIEGKNVAIERYSGDGRMGDYGELALKVVSSHPDVIQTTGPLSLHFKMATTTIPIISVTADPVAKGLVTSIARPGGNITGVTMDGGLELYGKRIGLLSEAVPKLSKACYLSSRINWESPAGAAVREGAQRAGISLVSAQLGSFSKDKYEDAFAAMGQPEGLVVSDEPEHLANRMTLIELVTKHKIPTIYPFRELVDDGGLMAYSVDLEDVYRRIASVIDAVLKGTNPGEIPFYQQTKFDLVMNVKTAKSLGLELPMLFARADVVIE